MVGYLLTFLLQIYCRAWWWKNFENRLAFRGVTGKNKVAPFFRTRCIVDDCLTFCWRKQRNVSGFALLTCSQLRVINKDLNEICSRMRKTPQTHLYIFENKILCGRRVKAYRILPNRVICWAIHMHEHDWLLVLRIIDRQLSPYDGVNFLFSLPWCWQQTVDAKVFDCSKSSLASNSNLNYNCFKLHCVSKKHPRRC